MIAISVRQPFAWAIAVGAKTIENRSRNVHWRGEVAIHASQAPFPGAGQDSRIMQLLHAGTAQDAPRGAIVAVARLVDCHPAIQNTDLSTCCEPWGMAVYNDRPAYHLVLADIHRLPDPVPCKGALQVGWVVPPETAVAVRAQLALQEA
jgi:hypothetical protein